MESSTHDKEHGAHQHQDEARKDTTRTRAKWAFIAFAMPQSKRDWRSFGTFSAFIFGGFWLLSAAWRVLYAAQREGRLAVEGPYARLRHPQYAGFVLIMIGFLLQWPTLVTLAMFPILVFMYVRLAHKEEREVAARFGAQYERYRARTPAFFPRLGARPDAPRIQE